MKSAAVIVTLLTLFTSTLSAHSEHEAFPLRHRHARRSGHKHTHKRHQALPAVKRSGQCPFPTDCGLVPVTPNAQNAGWAMSPDQPCTPGNFCPYACPSGQVMAQWDPAATSYVYPLNMHGGLYCNEDGTMSKPYPDKPYCVEGAGTYIAVNEAGEDVAMCQTVLPGNEAMLIPTLVGAGSQVTLAVPDPSYWCSTAAHFYVNPPGTTTAEGCVWGDASKPIGNWAPFVAGANQVAGGSTFVTAGINPIYCCEPANGYSQVDPGYGIRIECPGGGCNGLPCECNPSTMGVNKCTGGTVGAGGAEFCVVTVPSGQVAHLVIFSTSGDNAVSSAPIVPSNSDTSPAPVPPPSSSSSTSSSSSSSSSTSTSSSTVWTSTTTITVSPHQNATTYHRPRPSTSTDTEINIYPTALSIQYNQGHPANYSATTQMSIPLIAASATPSTSTSPATHLTPSILLTLTAFIVLRLINL